MPAAQPVSSAGAPEAVGAYVHAVRHGSTLYCSGSLPVDPASGELDNFNLATETTRSMTNLQSVCAAGGTDLGHALRLVIFTTHLDGFAEINDAYANAFTEQVPARTMVGVTALPKGARVEIDAIVAIPVTNERDHL